MKILLLFTVITTVMDFLNPFLGLVAPFITQFIKNKLKLQGAGAVLLAVIISIGLAFFGIWATGQLALATVATLSAEIFSAATLIYKLIMPVDVVQQNLPESLK